MTEIIKKDYLKRVCQPGTEKCCAYLLAGTEGFECAKLTPSIKHTIELKLTAGTMQATGDNCPGYGEENR